MTAATVSRTRNAWLSALPGAVRKLDPRAQWRNPVIFLVWVGAVLTTALAIAEPFLGGPRPSGGTEVPVSFTALPAAQEAGARSVLTAAPDHGAWHGIPARALSSSTMQSVLAQLERGIDSEPSEKVLVVADTSRPPR